MPHSSHGGRHELGYNTLIDQSVINVIDALVAHRAGPIVELGAGDGALTLPLSRSGRTITAVEIDPRNAQRLRKRVDRNVTVVTADVLRFRLPPEPHVVVGNLPFHLTTAIMRQLLGAHSWRSAVLVVQWEVARRRAGVGGASMLTANWWPWYEFFLHGRVPAHCFRPVPSVDAGILAITRRPHALVHDRAGYQRLVKAVFTGRGRGLKQVLQRTGQFSETALHRWMRANTVSSRSLPKELTAEQWVSLWELASLGATGRAGHGKAQVRGCPRT